MNTKCLQSFFYKCDYNEENLRQILNNNESSWKEKKKQRLSSIHKQKKKKQTCQKSFKKLIKKFTT